MWRYLKEFKTFTQDHPNQVLTLRYEVMIKNPNETVRKVLQFLNKPLSDETIEDIVDKISFNKLKAAYVTTQTPENTIENDQIVKDEKATTSKHTLANVTNVYEKGVSLQYRYPELKESAITGKIGDWKLHFTVAENEHFDRILHKE